MCLRGHRCQRCSGVKDRRMSNDTTRKAIAAIISSKNTMTGIASKPSRPLVEEPLVIVNKHFEMIEALDLPSRRAFR